MKLEDIGFYTLSDARVRQSSVSSPLWRCELLLTSRCNFKCPYCRRVGGDDLDLVVAERIVRLWARDGLRNIRFSGGEPTLYCGLTGLVLLSKYLGIERVAISTNGSAPLDYYKALIWAGVNDISVSLDACCAEDGDRMAGGVKGAWDAVVANIRALAKWTYVTVGVVLTEANKPRVNETVRLAHDLGVADIRVIPAAQYDDALRDVQIDEDLLAAHPILRYRVGNIQGSRPVRGIGPDNTKTCGLVLDDMAVMGDQHYPCIIYLREGGPAIGTVGPLMRAEREAWMLAHNSVADPICSKNCLDVCVDFNDRKSACSCGIVV